MMKLIMTVTLLLGLAVVGMGYIAQVRAMARSTHIVSRIATLRQENNLTECQEVETHAHLEIRKIQHSFVPLMWVGTLISVCSLAGIITATLRERQPSVRTVPD